MTSPSPHETRPPRSLSNPGKLKKRLSITDFLASQGFLPDEEKMNGWVYQAPYRPDRHPSLEVLNTEPQIWKDWAYNRGGDLIDLAMEVWGTSFGVTMDRLVALVPEWAGKGLKRPVMTKADRLDTDYIAWVVRDGRSPLEWDGAEEMCSRAGWTSEAWEQSAFITHPERNHILLYVRVGAHNEVLGLQFRTVDRKWSLPGTKAQPFFAPRPFNLGATFSLVVTEGETDLEVARLRWPTATVMGIPGVGVKPVVPKGLHVDATITLAFDADDAGRRATKQWAMYYGERGFKVYTTVLPEGGDLSSTNPSDVGMKEWHEDPT